TNRPFPSIVSDPNLCSNRRPVVMAQPVRYVNEGEVVKLVADAVDPDGDMLTFAFRQISGPVVTMSDGTFTAPQVDSDTELQFEISVSDGRAVSMPVTQSVIVRNFNKTPIVTLTPAEQQVTEKAT